MTKNWQATRGPRAAKRDGLPIGSPVYPYGAESYHVHAATGELARRFARRPGVQVHRAGLWIWA